MWLTFIQYEKNLPVLNLPDKKLMFPFQPIDNGSVKCLKNLRLHLKGIILRNDSPIAIIAIPRQHRCRMAKITWHLQPVDDISTTFFNQLSTLLPPRTFWPCREDDIILPLGKYNVSSQPSFSITATFETIWSIPSIWPWWRGLASHPEKFFSCHKPSVAFVTSVKISTMFADYSTFATETRRTSDEIIGSIVQRITSPSFDKP